MRRIFLLCLCLLLILSVPVFAETTQDSVEEAPDIIYVPDNAKLPKAVTYHGANEFATFDQGKKDGEALILDGNEFLSVDISEVKAPFTLSAWIYPQSDAANQRIFTLQKEGGENFIALSPFIDAAVVGKPKANGVTLLTSCFKDDAFLQENYYTPAIDGVSDKLPIDNWHHIALTVKKDTIIVYIDGVVWQTITLPFTYTELHATTLYIGNKPDGLGGFIGKMQDVTLHQTALGDEAVVRLAKEISPDDEKTQVTVGKYAAATLPAVETLEQSKTVDTDDAGKAVITSNTVAFWENPQVATGQTIYGTLTVKNNSRTSVSMQLSAIPLPEKDTPAYAYLSEVNVKIMQDATVLYDGPYTALQADALPFRWAHLPFEREYTYKVVLSRAFTSTAPTVAVHVPWEWESTAYPIANSPLQKTDTNGWLILVLVISTTAIGFSFYWAVIRRPRRIFTVWDTVFENIKKILKK